MEIQKNKKCIFCGNLLSGKRRKYCSNECSHKAYYNKNKNKLIAKSIKWQKENPQKYKENNKKAMKKYIKSGKYNKRIKEYYKNNKLKCNCRSDTFSILNNNGYTLISKDKYEKIEIKDKFCKICGSNKNLEIHHDIYFKNRMETANGIKNGKIYYLCKKCHNKKTNQKI